MTKELKDIILAKCDECERNGFDYLDDSDIMDILEECERRNIFVTRKELERLGMAQRWREKNEETREYRTS